MSRNNKNVDLMSTDILFFVHVNTKKIKIAILQKKLERNQKNAL
jgi:hypothetical protein